MRFAERAKIGMIEMNRGNSSLCWHFGQREDPEQTAWHEEKELLHVRTKLRVHKVQIQGLVDQRDSSNKVLMHGAMDSPMLSASLVLRLSASAALAPH